MSAEQVPDQPIVWLPEMGEVREAFDRINAEIEKVMTPPWWIERLAPSEQQAWWYEQWQATLRLRQMRQNLLLNCTTLNPLLPLPGGSLGANGLLRGPLIEPPTSEN